LQGIISLGSSQRFVLVLRFNEVIPLKRMKARWDERIDTRIAIQEVQPSVLSPLSSVESSNPIPHAVEIRGPLGCDAGRADTIAEGDLR
jgi:hypothetical protein